MQNIKVNKIYLFVIIKLIGKLCWNIINYLTSLIMSEGNACTFGIDSKTIE